MRSTEDQARARNGHDGKITGTRSISSGKYGNSGSASTERKPGNGTSDSADKRDRINAREPDRKSPPHKISDTFPRGRAGPPAACRHHCAGRQPQRTEPARPEPDTDSRATAQPAVANISLLRPVAGSRHAASLRRRDREAEHDDPEIGR
jgi:hypothetical protein